MELLPGQLGSSRTLKSSVHAMEKLFGRISLYQSQQVHPHSYDGIFVSSQLQWIKQNKDLTLLLPECLMGFCKVTLTFESVDQIL